MVFLELFDFPIMILITNSMKRTYHRLEEGAICVINVLLSSGDNPIAVQPMTNTLTTNSNHYNFTN